jgi:hypothetical protein
MASTEDHKTLVCGGCGKRYRIPASADRSGLKCKDCGSVLRLVREGAPAARRSEDVKRPVRRRRSPVPILIALGVSAVLVIVALVIYNRMDWLATEPEKDSGAIDKETAEQLKKLKNLHVAAKDPFLEKIGAMVETLHGYQVNRFPLYLESSAIYEFTMREQKKPARWKDLSMSERLQYPDSLRKQEPFSGRWRQAKLGEVRVTSSDVPGYLDHRWVVVPREFPGGEKDEVWLLVQDEGGRPRVRGFRRIVIQEGAVAKKDEPLPEAPKHDDTPGFQKKDQGLEREPLPATTKDGPIDMGGHPLAPIEPVPLVDGTPSGTESTIKGHIADLTDPEATRKAREALKELVFIGKPSIPVLLNQLVGKDLRKPEDVYFCHQIVQALREITGQRFGFEPQTGEQILTAASAAEQTTALKRWFGWWKINHKTFEPVLTPQLQQELEKRKHFKERFGK